MSDAEIAKLRKADEKKKAEKGKKRRVSSAAEPVQVATPAIDAAVMLHDHDSTAFPVSNPLFVDNEPKGDEMPELQDHRPFLVDQDSLFNPSRSSSMVCRESRNR